MPIARCRSRCLQCVRHAQYCERHFFHGADESDSRAPLAAKTTSAPTGGAVLLAHSLACERDSRVKIGPTNDLLTFGLSVVFALCPSGKGRAMSKEREAGPHSLSSSEIVSVMVAAYGCVESWDASARAAKALRQLKTPTAGLHQSRAIGVCDKRRTDRSLSARDGARVRRANRRHAFGVKRREIERRKGWRTAFTSGVLAVALAAVLALVATCSE